MTEREVGALAASGAYGAVIAGTGGRRALPAAWRGARRAGVPFLFWAAFWRAPRTPAHIAAYPLMLQIYSRAAAIVAYGEHVAGYVRGRGARNIHIAPQSVDNDFWRSRPDGLGQGASGPFRALFVGRPIRAKGLEVLFAAWERSGLAATGARLDVIGTLPTGFRPDGVELREGASATELRNFYGAADVLVIPSIRTRAFLEPWGLVANEAMNQGAAIISSDAVGAAAGGLVRHGRNGLIVRSGDPEALAAALRELAEDRARCRSLGEAGRRDVLAYSHTAWADGFAAALRSVGSAPDG